MPIYLLFTILIFCLLATYLCSIQYIKFLRGQTSRAIKDRDLILVSILFGGPVLFVMWCAFPEIRDEDIIHKHRVLICSIIFSIIQITIIVLLFVFGVIKTDNGEAEQVTNALRLLID